MTTTLSKLISQLAEKYDTGRRPLRYFDVPKRKELSRSEVAYVKRRFKELVEREECVKRDPEDPKCYEKVTTDKKPKLRKRKSSFLKDYEDIYRLEDFDEQEIKMFKSKIKAPKGLIRIAIETGIPLRYLKDVYDIGVGAYASSGSRTGMSAEQWGYGRVYAFIMCYFHNENGRYDSARFLKNKTDYSIFEAILNDL